MSPQTFKTRLKALDLRKKMILLGSALAVLSVFFPWYKDLDRFRTGDVFLGITGPLYLAGIIVMLGGIASLGLIMLEVMEKQKPKLPLNENHFHLFGAAVSILMLVLTNSVYFHNKFGINLVEKSMGIGMIGSIIGVGLLFLGAMLLVKNREVNFEGEGKIEPLIDIDINERMQSNIAERSRGEDEENVPTRAAEPENYQNELIGGSDPLQKLLNNNYEDERSDR